MTGIHVATLRNGAMVDLKLGRRLSFVTPQQTFVSRDGQYRFLLHRHYAANLETLAAKRCDTIKLKQSPAFAGLSLS